MLDKEIKTIIDVGVWDGTPDLYQRYPNSTKIHLVDPLDCEKNFVCHDLTREKELFFYECAVGDETGKFTFNYTESRDDMASLCLRTDFTMGERKEQQRMVDVKRLDDLFPNPEKETVLKLDIEGYELKALNGAVNLLKSITYVECEVSRPENLRFHDSYHFDDIFKFMYSHNYSTTNLLSMTKRICNVRFKNNQRF